MYTVSGTDTYQYSTVQYSQWYLSLIIFITVAGLSQASVQTPEACDFDLMVIRKESG